MSPDNGGTKLIHYTPLYQEMCFQAWYASGRPNNYDAILKSLPKDEHGRIPDRHTVSSWRDELGWDVRADDLDAKANAIVENDLINSRVLMLKEQAARGRELQVMGLNHLREMGFDSSSSAVQAVIRGADLEKSAKGISDTLVQMLKMDDNQLTGEVQKLLERASIPVQIMDMDEVPDVPDVPDVPEDIEAPELEIPDEE